MHESSSVSFGIGTVIDKMFEHFPTGDQIQNEIIKVVIFVHIPQSTNVGMSTIVVYAQEGVGFGLETGRVGVPPTDLLERHLYKRERV